MKYIAICLSNKNCFADLHQNPLLIGSRLGKKQIENALRDQSI